MIHGSIRYGRPPAPPMGSCFCFPGDLFWIGWVFGLVNPFSQEIYLFFPSPLLVCGTFCLSEIMKLLYISRLRINETVELRPSVLVGIIFYVIVFEEIINADLCIICDELVNHKGIQLSLSGTQWNFLSRMYIFYLYLSPGSLTFFCTISLTFRRSRC